MAKCNFEFELNGLDSDVLEVIRFSGEEEISRLFRFELDLLSTDKELDFAEIVNKPATLSMQRNPGGEESFFRGLVVDFQQYGETREKARYRVTLMPRTWRLSYTYQSCVFQDKTVETIIGDVLAEHGFSQGDIRFELIGDYAERDFCVQYRETDLDFICRLMEYEGMYFYFDHSQEQEVMVISDDRSNEDFIRDDQDSVVGYHQPEGVLPRDDVETINEFVYKEQIVTGKVILKDYNYRESELPLQGEATLNPEMPGMFYSYGSHFKDNEQGNRLAQVRNQEFECQRRTAEGRSDCIGLCGGYKMGLQGHYRKDLNADYLLIRVQHQGQMIEGQGTYSNDFTCIPSEVQYRPERRTPEPRLPGILTAKVEGSDDNSQYASIDEMGRYKVRLPFDQGDESLGSASKPIRLMQPSTGSGHGMHFPVHAGAEMIWACVDGNVDRPIGLGTAPNSSQVSPVTSENNNENLLQTSSGHRLNMDDNTENPTLTLSSIVGGGGGYGGGGDQGGFAWTETEATGGNTLNMDDEGIVLSTTEDFCSYSSDGTKKDNKSVFDYTTSSVLQLQGSVKSGSAMIHTPDYGAIINLNEGINLSANKTSAMIHGGDVLLMADQKDWGATLQGYTTGANIYHDWVIPIFNIAAAGILLIRNLWNKAVSIKQNGVCAADAFREFFYIVNLFKAVKNTEELTRGSVNKWYPAGSTANQGKIKLFGKTGIALHTEAGHIAINARGAWTGGRLQMNASEQIALASGWGGTVFKTMAFGIGLQAIQGGINLTSMFPADTIALDAPLGSVKITGGPIPKVGGVTISVPPGPILLPDAAVTKINLDITGITLTAPITTIASGKTTIANLNATELTVGENKAAVATTAAVVQAKKDAVSDSLSAVMYASTGVTKKILGVLRDEKNALTSN